jgi:N-acetylmuramoyl-L-alanine amidase
VRPLNEIIVHCTATRPDWWETRTTAQKVAEVKRWHVQDRGWSDIGYHFLIDRDGKVVAGRPLQDVGAHTQGHNTGTIGISLFGGHGSAATDAFAENYTPEQDKALRDLIAHLRTNYPSITKVSGHNQYAAKACPGFNVPTWYGEQSTTQPRATRLASFLKGWTK